MFNGTVLTASYKVASERGVPKPRVSTQEVPGLDGYFAMGTDFEPPEVVLYVYATGMGRAERREAAHDLMKKLLVRDFKRLEFGDDGGRYYMAQPSGDLDFHEFVRSGSLTVPMLVRDAAMYGATRSASVGTSATTVQVGGNYPARPVVVSSTATKSSSNLWGVRVDGGDFVRVPLTSSGSASVTIDCAARTARVAGVTSMVTLDSDWLELSPGSRTVVIDQGGGTATMTWTERWL